MLERVLLLGVNHRSASLALLLLVTVAAGFGLPKLRIDTGFDTLISDTEPNVAVYERIAREFGSDNRILIYVRDANLWSPEKLAALEKLHYSLEGLAFVERVDDVFTLTSVRGKAGKLDARTVLSEAPKEQAEADRARDDALYNPLLAGNIVARDGAAMALALSLGEDSGGDADDRQINAALETALAPYHGTFESLFQVGSPRINAELKAVLLHDLVRLGPLSALVLVVAVLFFLRSPFAATVPLITSALAITWTLGMMGWTGIPLNILSAMLPSLVVVIGSTEDTHIVATYLQGIARTEDDRRAFATRFMARHMGVPLLLTVLTTAMGFASNMASGIGLIQDFAIAATFAIVANGLITILVVPMMLTTLGPRRTGLDLGEQKTGGLPGLFVNLFSFSQRHFPRSLLVVTAAACGFFLYQASHLYVTNDPLSYFREDRPLVREIHQIHRDLAGVKVFYVTLEAAEDKAFLLPANLRKLAEIQAFLEQQGIFDSSVSLADHLSLVNREFHDGNARYYEVPQTRELVAQYLLFFHRRDLESYVSHDYRRANIIVRHDVSDSKTLNRHIQELQRVVAHIAGSGMKAHVVGENLMVNAAADSLLVAQVKSLGVLLLVIFLIMSAMFTSLKGGFISLVPNLIPITLMFGLMGLLQIPLNPGTAMVAVIAVGIAIDGTIHLFSRYNELCRRTADYAAAVHTTVREEATPMVATSLALALGFGILLTSDFTLIAQFGALAAATMLFALFANLLVTPIIMSWVRLVGLYQILAMSIHREVLQNSPLFWGMSNYQVRKAIVISELNDFEAGELLVEQGTMGRSMYLILSGEVEVVHRSGTDARQIAVLGPGQVFGEIGFVRETHRTADVRALTSVAVLRFDYEKLRKDLKLFPRIVTKLNINISGILGERLAEAMGGEKRERS